MDQIKQSRKEQDKILNDIENGIDTLSNHAHNIKDELELQSKIIDDMKTKMDENGIKIDSTNTNLTNLRKRYPNCVCYILCIFILIIIGMILYLLIRKN